LKERTIPRVFVRIADLLFQHPKWRVPCWWFPQDHWIQIPIFHQKDTFLWKVELLGTMTWRRYPITHSYLLFRITLVRMSSSLTCIPDVWEACVCSMGNGTPRRAAFQGTKISCVLSPIVPFCAEKGLRCLCPKT